MARRGTGKGKAGKISVQDHVLAILEEKDRRDQQRFDGQTRYLDAALASAKEAVQLALIAAEKAVTKAEVAAEKRFDAVNEFRGAYGDVIAQQMPRAEAEQRLQALSEKIDDLKLNVSASGGRTAGISALWGWLIGAVGVAIAVIAAIRK